MGTLLDESLTVAGRPIGAGNAPYVIAEAGSNFDQDLDTGRRLIDFAADAGADAVKFQLFRAEALYPAGHEMHAAFKAVELNPDWVPALAAHAGERGVAFMASAFDPDSVRVLEDADVPAHKVASSEATNMALLDQIAATGKPIFLSTGMCDAVDVEEAVTLCRARGNTKVSLLQCGTMYPLPAEHAHLRVMDMYRQRYGGPVGWSDHSLGLTLAIAAVGHGAAVIEKHFTHDRGAEGPDHFYALEPSELTQLVAAIHEVHAALGTPEKEMLPSEREFGRREGLYAARDIPAGARLSDDDIAIRRPAIGLRARYRAAVAGAQALQAIEAGAPLQWADIQL